MKFQKLKLKKTNVMELSSGVETLPREATNQAAGGVTTSRGACATLPCGTFTEGPGCIADTERRRCVSQDNCNSGIIC